MQIDKESWKYVGIVVLLIVEMASMLFITSYTGGNLFIIPTSCAAENQCIPMNQCHRINDTDNHVDSKARLYMDYAQCQQCLYAYNQSFDAWGNIEKQNGQYAMAKQCGYFTQQS